MLSRRIRRQRIRLNDREVNSRRGILVEELKAAARRYPTVEVPLLVCPRRKPVPALRRCRPAHVEEDLKAHIAYLTQSPPRM